MILGPWEATWPAPRLGELLSELVARSGFARGRVENPPASFDSGDFEQVELWVDAASDWLGVESEPTQAGYNDVESFVRHGGPAVLRLRVDREFRFLGILGARRSKVRLLTPEGEIAAVPVEAVRDWLCARLEDPIDSEVRAFLRRAGVSEREEERSRRAILGQRLGASRIGGMWMIRPGAGSSFTRSLRRAGIPSRLGLLTIGHAVQYALYLAAWVLIGRAALEGRVDPGWMAAWVLILLTLVPLRSGVTWLPGSGLDASGRRAQATTVGRRASSRARRDPASRHRRAVGQGTRVRSTRVARPRRRVRAAPGRRRGGDRGGRPRQRRGWLVARRRARAVARDHGRPRAPVLPPPRPVDRLAPRHDAPVGGEPARLSDTLGAGGARALARSRGSRARRLPAGIVPARPRQRPAHGDRAARLDGDRNRGTGAGGGHRRSPRWRASPSPSGA